MRQEIIYEAVTIKRMYYWLRIYWERIAYSQKYIYIYIMCYVKIVRLNILDGPCFLPLTKIKSRLSLYPLLSLSLLFLDVIYELLCCAMSSLSKLKHLKP
jgi:hypothetical protein